MSKNQGYASSVRFCRFKCPLCGVEQFPCSDYVNESGAEPFYICGSCEKPIPWAEFSSAVEAVRGTEQEELDRAALTRRELAGWAETLLAMPEIAIDNLLTGEQINGLRVDHQIEGGIPYRFYAGIRYMKMVKMRGGPMRWVPMMSKADFIAALSKVADRKYTG